MDVARAFVSGIVVIGLVTAVGLHGTALATFVKAGGGAASGVLGTAETGKNES
jgi:hypothetical protein